MNGIRSRCHALFEEFCLDHVISHLRDTATPAVALPGVFGAAVNSDQRTKSCLPDLTFLERKT